MIFWDAFLLEYFFNPGVRCFNPGVFFFNPDVRYSYPGVRSPNPGVRHFNPKTPFSQTKNQQKNLLFCRFSIHSPISIVSIPKYG